MKKISIEFELFDKDLKIYSGCVPEEEKEGKFYFEYKNNLNQLSVRLYTEKTDTELFLDGVSNNKFASCILEDIGFYFSVSRVKNKTNRVSIFLIKSGGNY